MTPEVVLTAVNLHKHFYQGANDLHVLRGIDLTVRRGERIAIVGRAQFRQVRHVT